MTKKEIAEIFSLWSLNWPSAEMFQGGSDLLNARITLYASRLQDVNYFYGKKGALVSIDTRKFLPTIAEYREDIAAVAARYKRQVDFLFEQVINQIHFSEKGGQPVEIMLGEMLPVGREIIDRMGGWKAFAPDNEPFYNRKSFEEAFLCMQAEKEGLPSGSDRRLSPK